MCFKYHPDRCKDPNIDANKKFSEIREAYDFLIGKSTSFVAPPQSKPQTTTQATQATQKKNKKQHTSPPSPSSNAQSREGKYNTTDADKVRLADETLMPLMDAMQVLETSFNAKQGVPINVIEDAYRRCVLKLYLKRSGHVMGKSEYDEKLELTSTAYDRILLHIDFKQYWKPPYAKIHRRVRQCKREDQFIAEYVSRQNLLQTLHRGRKDTNQEKEKEEKGARVHETVQRQFQKSRDAEHAVEHAKKFAKVYSASHGQHWQDETQKNQYRRQIHQQSVAQEQHAAEHNLCHVKLMSRKRRACNTSSDESLPPKKPRGMDGAVAEAGTQSKEKAGAGQHSGNPIVLDDT